MHRKTLLVSAVLIPKVMPSLKCLGLGLLQRGSRIRPTNPITASLATSSDLQAPRRWARPRPMSNPKRTLNPQIEKEMDIINPIIDCSEINKGRIYSAEEYESREQEFNELNSNINKPNNNYNKGKASPWPRSRTYFPGTKSSDSIPFKKREVYGDDECSSDSQDYTAHYKKIKQPGLPHQKIYKPAERMRISFDHSLKAKQWKAQSNGDMRYGDVQHWKSMPPSKGTPRYNNIDKLISPATGNDILFGVSPCLLALKANRRKIVRAYVRRGLVDAENNRPEIATILTELSEKGIEIVQLHRSVLDKMTKHRPHQGICLEVSRLYYTPFLEEQGMEVPDNKMPVWLALDQILDPMNLGAVLRSSYFLGVDGVVVSKKNSCSLTPVVSKASSGVMEIQPVHAVHDLANFLQSLIGWEIIGSSSSDDLYRTEHDGNDNNIEESGAIDIQKPTVLVVGSEGFGLRDEIVNCCNTFLTIRPGRDLHSGVDSLNVSVATGILLNLLLTNRNSQLRKE